MTITGAVYNASTKEPVDFEVMVWGPDSLMLHAEILKAGQKYIATETDDYLSRSYFVFNAKGYASQTFTGAELKQSGGNVFLRKTHTAMLIVLAIAALYFTSIQAKKKKVGKVEAKDVMPWLLIVGGVLGFNAIMRLLQTFGLADGPGETAVNNNMTNPTSPFNAGFWNNVPNTVSPLIITSAATEKFITQIHDAFTVFQDDFNVIWGVFSQLKTKSQVAYLSQKFAEKYKESLLPFLTDGGGILPWDGLSDKHLAQIVEFVNKLPLYQP